MTKKTAVKKASAKKKAPRRMLIVDVPGDPISTASSLAAVEKAKLLTFPCVDCGEETNPSNRSILQDGRTMHIGCPKRKPREVTKVEHALSGLPKHKGAKVPKPPATPVSEYGDIQVMSDYQGRTCIQVKRDIATVTFIPIDVSGFHLTYLDAKKFDERFRPIEKYPVKKACEHYLRYAVEYGATQDVLDHLGRVVTITEEQSTMAKKNLASKSEAAGSTTSSKGKSVKQPGEKRESASNLFKQLIMEGKLTDDAIFAKVKEKFGLDDKKRGYVAWYRNHLKKEGKNPPEAKRDPKAEKAAAKPEKKAAPKKAAKKAKK